MRPGPGDVLGWTLADVTSVCADAAALAECRARRAAEGGRHLLPSSSLSLRKALRGECLTLINILVHLLNQVQLMNSIGLKPH